MSLLEKATLITTPTAHSNGTLHSIKGGAVADFDVVRGSAATRVNAEGLIEDISVLSGELVTDGGFNDASNWDGQATIANSTLTKLDNGLVRQSTLDVSVKSYKVTVDINTLGSPMTIYLGGTNEPLIEGVNTIYMQSGGANNLVGFNNGGGSVINSISVKEVIDATNIPRIDYTTGEGVVLLEPQSTNLITYSEDFSNASWSKIGNSSFGFVTGIAPDGTTSVYEITSDGGGGKLQNTIGGLTINTEYILSFYAKKESDITLVQSRVLSLTGGSGGTNLTTVDYQNDLITDQWVRITHTFTTDDTLGNYILYLSNALTSGDTLQVYGAQLEALPYDTSYIPTSGAIATRLADSVTGAGDATTFNSTEGVLYFEGSALVEIDANNRHIGISDGTNNNRLYFYYNTSGRFGFAAFVGGVLQVVITYDGIVLNNSKIACKYKENDYALWVNGVEVATDTNASVWSNGTLNRLDFSQPNGSSSPLFGKVKALAVFNEALTDSELECLTTI